MDTGSILFPLWISFKLAFVTTIVLLVIGSLLAYLLVYRRVPGRAIVESLINLPIVFPPTVLGFSSLLVLMSPKGAIRPCLGDGLPGCPLLFTFTGIVIASLVYSLPFAVAPMKTAFAKIDRLALWKTPMSWAAPLPPPFSGRYSPTPWPVLQPPAILVFLHTIGEFGVILMVGGSIPGKTKAGVHCHLRGGGGAEVS